MGYQPTDQNQGAALPQPPAGTSKTQNAAQSETQTQSAAQNENLFKPITKLDDLLEYFQSGVTKPENVAIGMEVEKQGIHKDTLQPITYLEQNGLRKIQEKLMEELGWEIERQEGKIITSMKRGETRMTLEIGESMGELSGRTHPSIHDLARELRIHRHEITEMSKLFGVVWLSIGYPPFEIKDDIRLLKIERYKILDAYMRKRSKIPANIWRKVCTVQANIDYTSEDDARKKFQILLRLAPFLTAMYAHSPLKDGKESGFVSYRTHLLRKADPRRMGVRKSFFSGRFGFKQWAEFCLKVPMIGIVRDGNWISAKKMTFNQFLKSGCEGYAARLEDWILHLSYVYTDVRIKKYIELRVCDSLPPALIPSMQAIVKGFVYHKDGERAINEITKKWRFRDFAAVYHDIAKKGMQTERCGKKLLDYCKEILNTASDNLKSLKVLNEKGEDESVHLQPIKDFVFVKEKSPGAWVLEMWNGSWNKTPERLIEWCMSETNGGL